MGKAGLAHTKLAELAVGDEQSTKGSQSLEGIVAITLGRVLVGGLGRTLDALGVKVSRLPDKVLEEVALVLGQQKLLGELDNLARVTDELLALPGELV